MAKVHYLQEPQNMLLSCALEYASKGWLVLPLYHIDEGICACKKGKECSSPGKHPISRKGVNDATIDAEKIKAWWNRHPHANIGVRTGAISNLVVVDVDPRNDGIAGFNGLDALFGPFAPTMRAETGGGGFHLYYRSCSPSLRCSNSKLAQGVDTKANGGYVVAPPSNHISGGYYQYKNIHSPILAAPDWLLEESLPSPVPTVQAITPETFQSGNRNTALTSIAGKLRNQGKGRDQIISQLLAINENTCQPPLCEQEVMGIADSSMRYDERALVIRWRSAFMKSGLKPGVRYTLFALSTFMSKEGAAFPSLETIAQNSNQTRKTVANHLQKAESEGFIKRFKRAVDGKDHWSYYYIATIPSPRTA
ncbi:MAG: bifunctional DNA primase/polymerase [Halopseudomonas sp.]